MVQLSHLYMTTGKAIALCIWTFVSKVMSLLFNTLCRLVIAFLPRSKHTLILWLQSPSAVILEAKKRKSVTASTFPSSIRHEVKALDAMILDFLMLNFKPAFSLFSFILINLSWFNHTGLLSVSWKYYFLLGLSPSYSLCLWNTVTYISIYASGPFQS